MHRFLPKGILLLLFSSSFGAHAETGKRCGAYNGLDVLCLSSHSEDLVKLPDTRWLIISNPLRLLDTVSDKSRVVAEIAIKFDHATYRSCPGPIAPTGARKMGYAGSALNLRVGRPGTYTLYMRGPERRIEVFDLDARPKIPRLTWVGCIPTPQGLSLNAIAPLPGKRLVATNFASASFGNFATPEGRASLIRSLSNSEPTGDLWEWGPDLGWSKIPGTEGSGLNGIESSKDGRILYGAEWGRSRIIMFQRGKAGPPRVVTKLNFRPDNIRLQPDGSLVIGGHRASVQSILNDCSFEHRCREIHSSAVILDPLTRKIRYALKDLPLPSPAPLSSTVGRCAPPPRAASVPAMTVASARRDRNSTWQSTRWAICSRFM
ncbi:exported hypothetical protein [Novosphingobium sp. KN65.2]|nr:exported hypothetical protein [Novosphingobium sp. KN65.2]